MKASAGIPLWPSETLQSAPPAAGSRQADQETPSDAERIAARQLGWQGEELKLDPGLAAELGPLMPLLYRRAASGRLELPEDIIEVSVNGPGQAWVERPGRGYEPLEMPGADRQWAEDLFVTLANLNQRDHRAPTLSAPLPGGHRVQMVVGEANVARTGMAISVRVMRHKLYGWSDYGVGDVARGPEHAAAGRALPVDAELDVFSSGFPLGTRADLETVLRQGWPVLLVGETNSGKTSFLRMLMQLMPRDRRVITIEDEAELWQSHPNQVGLTVPNPAHYPLFVKAILRMNPGAVIGGEIQADNAYPLFRLLIAGHRNFLTTIHGGSPEEGFEAWIANITMNAGLGPQAAASVRRPLARALARIIHLGPDRKVNAVISPRDALARA